MKLHRKFKFAVWGVVLLCAAVSSSALTLGRAKGAVLLGQTLKLIVPVQLESGEGLSAQCFEAEVFYGDSRQDPSRVRVTTDATAASQAANVYITAMVGVDEPVVTVYLRSGCEGKTTRRYVLLAEQANDVMPQSKQSGSASVLPQQPSMPTALPKVPASNVRVETSVEKRPHKSKAPVLVQEGREEPRTPARQRPQARSVARDARPRLKLDLLDLTEAGEPQLKLSNELQLSETEDLEKRAQAAALWRSLNATPQDILSAESRRQTLESDIKGLHDVTEKNRLLLQDLKGRLDTAQSQRYANPLVYGLVALSLLCCAALVLIWRRTQSAEPAAIAWPEEEVRTGPQPLDGESVRMPQPEPVPQSFHADAPPSRRAEKTPAPVTQVDIDLQLDDAAALPQEVRVPGVKRGASMMQADKVPSAAGGHLDFANSMAASFRSVNTQEMLDVRQQAEFFMTLGQHEEAVTVLKDSIGAVSEANPLVYLDLLKVLHTLGRKTEYDDYRKVFNATFSGHVPTYAEFNHAGSGLEAYPDVCDRIVALWPSEQAVSLIEHCLVRDDGDEGVQGFDLEAFRDLLMLHGVARRVATSLDSGFLPFSAARAQAPEASRRATQDSAVFRYIAEDTQPLSAQPGAAKGASVDLDVSQSNGNLIDFDTEDLMPPRTPTKW